MRPRVAARDVGEHVPRRRHQTAAGGQALVVLAAARAAATGAPVDVVADVARDVASASGCSARCPTSNTSCGAAACPGSRAGPGARSASTRCSSSAPARSTGSDRRGSTPRSTAWSRGSDASPLPGTARTSSRCTRSRPKPPTSAWPVSATPTGRVVRQRIRPGDGRPHRPRAPRPRVVVGTGQRPRVDRRRRPSRPPPRPPGGRLGSCACHAPGTRSSRRGSGAASYNARALLLGRNGSSTPCTTATGTSSPATRSTGGAGRDRRRGQLHAEPAGRERASRRGRRDPRAQQPACVARELPARGRAHRDDAGDRGASVADSDGSAAWCNTAMAPIDTPTSTTGPASGRAAPTAAATSWRSRSPSVHAPPGGTVAPRVVGHDVVPGVRHRLRERLDVGVRRRRGEPMCEHDAVPVARRPDERGRRDGSPSTVVRVRTTTGSG